MTTNKPPIAAWAPSTALHKLASRHNNAPCILTDGPAEFNDVALVRLFDYEALQAECEELRKHLQNLIDQTTPLEPVPGNPMWSRRIQLDEVMAERDQLRAECEKLRRDAETERAIQRAAEVLPTGFRIEIEIEKDGGGVALFSPGAIVECDFHGGIAEQIADAIDAAMQEENK